MILREFTLNMQQHTTVKLMCTQASGSMRNPLDMLLVTCNEDWAKRMQEPIGSETYANHAEAPLNYSAML